MSNTSPTQHTPIIPGSVLAGKYRVERIIGQGGMGVVVEARHIALDDRVALKFLLPEHSQNPEAAARFLREARAAVKIKSEHVARVSDVGTLDSGAPYMVMEFLEGADLSQTLERLGVLQVEDAVDYITQGCEAIAEAHQHGIVHRDLKPANLFLSKRPDGMPIVKVLDFGISKDTNAAVDNLTKTTAAMGSALYMSPEQMQQTRSVDHRTDIYALGIALYELLAGKQPFYAETLPQLCAEILTGTPTPIRTLRPEVPGGLAQVMEKAYARDKGQRHQSIADLVVALAPYAPARTQQTIERVAGKAGPPVPSAGGAAARASYPSYPSDPGGAGEAGRGGRRAGGVVRVVPGVPVGPARIGPAGAEPPAAGRHADDPAASRAPAAGPPRDSRPPGDGSDRWRPAAGRHLHPGGPRRAPDRPRPLPGSGEQPRLHAFQARPDAGRDRREHVHRQSPRAQRGQGRSRGRHPRRVRARRGRRVLLPARTRRGPGDWHREHREASGHRRGEAGGHRRSPGDEHRASARREDGARGPLGDRPSGRGVGQAELDGSGREDAEGDHRRSPRHARARHASSCGHHASCGDQAAD